jgi:hypothetical protein
MRAQLGTARAVAALFVLATAAAIVGGSLLLPLTESTSLAEVSAADGQIVTGALIELVLVLSVVGIAVLIYPVLRRRNEGLALAYVGSRMVEAVLLLVAAISALVVLGLAREAGSSAGSAADAALATREWTYLIGSETMLGVSALILYSLLLRARLVPAWLSLWGLVGGLLILGTGVFEMYGFEFSGLAQGLLAAPIGLNEMVLAAWLIVRGFDERGLPESGVPQGASSGFLASSGGAEQG